MTRGAAAGRRADSDLRLSGAAWAVPGATRAVAVSAATDAGSATRPDNRALVRRRDRMTAWKRAGATAGRTAVDGPATSWHPEYARVHLTRNVGGGPAAIGSPYRLKGVVRAVLEIFDDLVAEQDRLEAIL